MSILQIEAPILLEPEINDELAHIDDEAYSLIYDIPESVRSIDWNGNLIAFGHTDGISVLSPVPADSYVSKSLPNKFQQQWVFQVNKLASSSPVNLIKFTSRYLVAALDDNSVNVVNHQHGNAVKLDTSCLKDDINALDVSSNSYVVVAGDDKTVAIYDINKLSNLSPIHTLRLDNIPTLVKFWIDNDSDKLIVVENGTTVKIFNWREKRWIVTIYPKPFSPSLKPYIQDVIVKPHEFSVIEDTGIVKTYHLSTLKGGAGYTFPSSQSQLQGWLYHSKYISSSTTLRQYAGGINPDRSLFYDLSNTSGNVETYQFKLKLPSLVIPCGSINHHGIVALISGSKLILVRPFDSYEAI